MKRHHARLAVLGVTLATAVTAIAADSPAAGTAAIRVSQVAANVYLLEGPGGNIAAQVGDDGIVLVDDESAALASKVEAALRSLSSKPLRLVINTHYHADHVGGNEYFQTRVPAMAHHNVRTRMQLGGTTGNGGSLHFPAAAFPEAALPVLTYDSTAEVHLNGEDIRVAHFPSAHTDGDSIVFFPKSNVVHMGDVFVTHFPFVDVEAGGSLDGLINAVDQVVTRLSVDARVIPGHGPLSTRDDLVAYIKMLKETRAAVAQALHEGKTLDQMKQGKLLDPWARYAGEFVTPDAYLETISYSLTRASDRHD